MNENVVRPNFQRVELTLDIGQVPHPHRYGGKWVITVQVAPIDNVKDANEIASAIRQAIESRLAIKFTREGSQ